jgi:hypothetical protein
MKTGAELWRVDGPEDDWGIDVGGGFVGEIFYTAGFAGVATGYNIKLDKAHGNSTAAIQDLIQRHGTRSSTAHQ